MFKRNHVRGKNDPHTNTSMHRHAFVLRFLGDVDSIIHCVHKVILYHIRLDVVMLHIL